MKNKFAIRRVVISFLSTVFWLGLMIFLLHNHGTELTSKWDEEQNQQIANAYSESQYVKGEAGVPIDDATLYLYASMAYNRGEDPTTINFEHPPLSKYLKFSYLIA